MEKKYQNIIAFFGEGKVVRNELLEAHTTFKIGGPSDLYLESNSEEDFIKAIKISRESQIPYLILGGGSNLLVGDKGFRGIVIRNQSAEIKVQNQNGKFFMNAEAGVMMGTLLNEAVDNCLTGLEFMAGIPGTLGGSVVGNAGAWKKSLSEVVARVKIITSGGKVKWLSREECNFDYRSSRFKGGNEVVLAAELELTEGDKEEIKKLIAENLQKRICQPREPSAGCVFVNPKPLSAGELIDQAGLKGRAVGKAQISEKHANFIINLGGAKAVDVVSLIELVKKEVKNKFNIELREEILRVGEF